MHSVKRMIDLSINPIFQNLWFITGFSWNRVAAHKDYSWLNVTKYMFHTWPRICSTCRKHVPVLSSFMTSSPVPSVIRVSWSLVFCALFWRSVFVPFLLVVVLSVLLPLTYSVYTFWYLQTFLIVCEHEYKRNIAHLWFNNN
jgi:hypothetical protein